MALFGFGKNKKEERTPLESTGKQASLASNGAEPEPKKVVSSKTQTKKETKNTPKTSATNLTGVILKPRITEKASILVETSNVYTFDIDPRASKQEVAKAVEAHYKVKPLKVNITDIKSKKVLRRGKKGVKAGGRKAMVYLRKGDKIEFV